MWTVCYTKETALEGEVGLLEKVGREGLSLMEPSYWKTDKAYSTMAPTFPSVSPIPSAWSILYLYVGRPPQCTLVAFSLSGPLSSFPAGPWPRVHLQGSSTMVAYWLHTTVKCPLKCETHMAMPAPHFPRVTSAWEILKEVMDNPVPAGWVSCSCC